MDIPRRLWLVAAVIAVLAVHLGPRLWGWRNFYPSGNPSGLDRPLFSSSDPHFHAHRIDLLRQHAPALRFHDPYMFHPAGAAPEWPLGFDWPLALVAWPAGGLGLPWEWALPFVPVLLSLAGLWLFVAVARRYLPPRLTFLAALAAAANLALVRVARVGELDHHVQEVTGVVLLLLVPGVLASDNRRGPAVLLGAGLAFACWNTTLFAFLLAAFFLLWLVLRLGRAGGNDVQNENVRAFTVALLVGLWLMCAVEAIGRRAPLALHTLSFLHAAAVTVCLAGWRLAGRVPAWRVLGLLGLALAGAVALDPERARWAARLALGSNDFFFNISEARPLLVSPDGFTFAGIHMYFGLLFVVFPVAFLGVRRRGPAALPPVTLWYALGLFLLAVAQRRYVHLFAPAFILVSLVWLSALPGRPALRRLAVALGLVLLLEPTVWFWRALGPAGATVATREALPIARRLRAASPTVGMGVSAPPNMGPVINWHARLPTVTNTFFYPQYLSFDLRLRHFETVDELVAELRRSRIEFLVAADDVRYRSMLLRLFGREAEAKQTDRYAYTPCAPALLRFAYDRLACLEGPAPGLERIGVETYTTDPTRLIRRATVYRVLRATP